MHTMVTVIHGGKVVRRIVLITRRKFFFKFFLLYLREKMGVSGTYCGPHFTIHVNQTITLHTCNLHSDLCQLLHNKTGQKFYFYTSTRSFHKEPEIRNLEKTSNSTREGHLLDEKNSWRNSLFQT